MLGVSFDFLGWHFANTDLIYGKAEEEMDWLDSPFWMMHSGW